MGIDTPNVLSRETTFLMGILKKCFSVEKVPIKQGNIQANSTPVSLSDQIVQELPSMEGTFGHSVPSTEGVFCHSVTSAKGDLSSHSVLSTEDRSQMNCASIQDMAESPKNQIS